MAALQPVIAAIAGAGLLAGSATLRVAGSVEQMPGGKIRCELTDGKENIAGVFTTQCAKAFGDALQNKAVVKIDEANVTSSSGGMPVLVIAKAELLGATGGGLAQPEAQWEEPTPAAAAPKEEPAAKTPGAAVKSAPFTAATPANHPTPPSTGWAQKMGGSASKRPLQPISALNPYNNNWAVKAKVVNKGPKRSFSRGSVFSAEIVDEQGTAIEATFWREAADHAHELLEEGKVYIFGRGNVKPADKRYSRVRNDYALHFDTASELESCADDIDTSKMQAKMEFVPIDQLAAYVDKKMMVDVIGVVTEVKPLGSVKRKTDQVELSRRDITLVDQGLKTVVVTLWGATAEGPGRELEEQADATPVVAISSCRVSSYNGVSVSSLQRSAVLVNPDLPEATALRQWWESSGCTAATSHVGEGLATAIKRTGSGAGADRETLEAFRAAAPASTEDKPRYATVTATFSFINADQALYYMANPENNRKVVEQGPGQYYCEYDGTTLSSMVRRYIFNAKVMDESGEAYVQVFNDQAEQLLGMKADELAEIRESDAKRFQDVLKSALWRDNVLRLKAQAQEYNGETRQRYALQDIRSTDYAAECRRLLSLIGTAA
ncbi:hypothetical protein COHA_000848 [Chlorella ohadii]|uniref:Replication protein A subunit n=1 Tax=Chlorella ohadii TaxID=2649997 RepID=A0AAD5H9Q3_9CHLO|nr:hypothetical protein COHA_000848 [Chlorella ohadii]